MTAPLTAPVSEAGDAQLPGEGRIWLLTGGKAGDDSQARLLASELACPVEEKPLVFKSAYVKGKPWFRASFAHLAEGVEHGLRPPWPTLVLAIGRRPTMAALEIVKRSGGVTRVVVLGRPRQGRGVALSIAPAQFLVSDDDAVLRVPWPLLCPDLLRIEAAVENWKSRFAALPRPVTAVLVGGATVPYALGSREGKDLVAAVRRATREQGSIYFCTSRRSGRSLVRALQSCVSERPQQERLFAWSASGQEENPYLALLGFADRFVVTGDSLSMMLEVAQLSKPLALHIPPFGLRPRSLVARASKRLLYRWNPEPERFEPRRLTKSLLTLGVLHHARDLGIIHRQLIACGRAALLGERFASQPGPLDLEIERAVRRVHDLMRTDSFPRSRC